MFPAKKKSGIIDARNIIIYFNKARISSGHKNLLFLLFLCVVIFIIPHICTRII